MTERSRASPPDTLDIFMARLVVRRVFLIWYRERFSYSGPVNVSLEIVSGPAVP